MSETETVLWRDSFDDEIIHIGTRWPITRNKTGISHAGAIHMQVATDIFGRAVADVIRKLPQGQVFGVKMTLEVEED